MNMNTSTDQQIKAFQAQIDALVAEAQTAERERCIRLLNSFAADLAPSLPDDEREAFLEVFVSLEFLLRAGSRAL